MNVNPFEEIQNRLSIVDVVGGYIDIKHSGRNFRCVCPFHKEKSGSLMLSPDRNIWHCFGCGVGGNMFKFVEMYENVDIKTALNILSKKAGVELQTYKPTQVQLDIKKEIVDNHTQGQKYLEWATNIYHQILLKVLGDSSSPITKYCRERGLDTKTITKFRLGYAPKGDFILNLAITHKMDTDLLQSVGLIRKMTERNQLKDKFADRLMIPISDAKGQAVGFTGRVLPYDVNPDRPKYLNSSQSEWFNKSKIWYGYYEHVSSIRQRKEVLIVEGNMDVIKASQCGLDYVLASQGTSFTVDQLQLLKRLTSKVLLAFDNDIAGVLATKKFFRQSTALGFGVHKVLIDSQYKDLDEMLSDAQLENANQNINQTANLKTLPFLDYFLQVSIQELQSTDASIQRQVLMDFLYLLAVCDPITKEQYLQRLVEITKFSKEVLTSELSNQPIEKLETYQTEIIPEKPAVSSSQVLLINWQQVCALDTDKSKLEVYFPLVKALLLDLKTYETFGDYYFHNQTEIGFIADKMRDNVDQISTSWQRINSFLDRNVQFFYLDTHLTENYVKIKSL